MNQPSSSSIVKPPSDLPVISVKKCQVCGKEGHGNHFGAITCRACAAFFRRFGITNNFTPCSSKNKKCGEPKNGRFRCKMCRLQKCRSLGMTDDNFQFQRDSFSSKEIIIPPSIDTFIGRSNLIIFCAPPNGQSDKKYIDVHFLIDKASEVLAKGSETPLTAPNSLEKLALGLQNNSQKYKIRKRRTLQKVGREETFELWENDVLKVAKWLTYFDEFQQLPHKLRLDMLKGMWIVWSRLEKFATIATARREKIVGNNQVLLEIAGNQMVFELGTLEIDLSWCSRYSFEQLKFFGQPKLDRINRMISFMTSLNPTDVELAYMLCQLSLHHVGKRYQGEILEVTERLLDSISNDLHDYYTNRLRMERYADRVTNMMKINNGIRFWVNERRRKVELMNIFDVFYVEYSDPEMFVDF